MSTLQYRADIDGLRAVAILGVLLFHLGYSAFPGGFVGVDVFFVISGFLITALIRQEIIETGRWNVKNFYMRRIRRLFPALFVTLFVTIVFAVLVFSPTHLSRIGGALVSALFSVSNIYFWAEADYFDITAKLKPFLHTWSLSVEEQFYLFWPWLLLLSFKLKRDWIAPVLLVVLAVVSLWLNVVFADGSVEVLEHYFPAVTSYISDGRATIFFLLPFRIFEFAIGAVLVWLVSLRTPQWLTDILFAAGLVMIFYAVMRFSDRLVFPSFYGLVPTLGAAFVIYSGSRSRFRMLLANKVMVGIGLVSYSLYLIHWPLIVFWTYLEGKPDTLAKVVILLLSLLLAVLSYRYIEQPFRKRRYEITAPKWKYGFLAATILMSAAGIHMKQYNGWTWRVPKTAVFEHAGNAADYHIKFYGGAGYIGKYPRGSKQADIILMGDSHAQQYAEGLYKVLTKGSGHILYVSECFSCLYLPGFVNATQPHYVKLSLRALQRDLAYIRRAHPKMVIIAESWLHQIKQADMVDEKGRRKHIKVTEEAVIQGILELKRQIGESTLVVIGQVPGARYNLYDVFSRPRPLLFSDFDAKKYTEVSEREDFTAFNARLKEAASRTGAFVFLDPHDVLCEDGICHNLDEDKHLIYSDAYHLSKYGSIKVIKGFYSELKALLDVNENTTSKDVP